MERQSIYLSCNTASCLRFTLSGLHQLNAKSLTSLVVMYPKHLYQKLMINGSSGNATDNLAAIITYDNYQGLGSLLTHHLKVEFSQIINKYIENLILMLVVNFYIHQALFH